MARYLTAECAVTMPPLGLYLHVPFCVRKCPYCDFYSCTGSLEEREPRYLDAILQELHSWRRQLADDARPLTTLFLGGGTPSRLQPATIKTILETIARLWPLDAGCEITLEANPESTTPRRLAQWRAAGINRLSLGVQAFDPERLQLLQRPHDLATALRAITAARAAGFSNLNLDLIYATPGQDLDSWRAELEQALQWNPEHLSCYALTVAPNTPFHNQVNQGALPLPDEEAQMMFFTTTRAVLRAAGWLPYEISNFARPGFFCRHNNNVWEYGDFLGIGPAAHGKLTLADGRVLRTANGADLEQYQTSASAEILSSEAAGEEALLLGVRLESGLRRALYQQLTGTDLVSHRHAVFAELLEAGLVEVTPEHIRLTGAGLLLADYIVTRLVVG